MSSSKLFDCSEEADQATGSIRTALAGDESPEWSDTEMNSESNPAATSNGEDDVEGWEDEDDDNGHRHGGVNLSKANTLLMKSQTAILNEVAKQTRKSMFFEMVAKSSLAVLCSVLLKGGADPAAAHQDTLESYQELKRIVYEFVQASDDQESKNKWADFEELSHDVSGLGEALRALKQSVDDKLALRTTGLEEFVKEDEAEYGKDI